MLHVKSRCHFGLGRALPGGSVEESKPTFSGFLAAVCFESGALTEDGGVRSESLGPDGSRSSIQVAPP